MYFLMKKGLPLGFASGFASGMPLVCLWYASGMSLGCLLRVNSVGPQKAAWIRERRAPQQPHRAAAGRPSDRAPSQPAPALIPNPARIHIAWHEREHEYHKCFINL